MYFLGAKEDVATPLYTVDPLKNHPTDAFYSSAGSSRHQSLKDKCASSLALTAGICRRFFLQRPSRRFIILSKFHHFILETRDFWTFSLLLLTPAERLSGARRTVTKLPAILSRCENKQRCFQWRYRICTVDSFWELIFVESYERFGSTVFIDAAPNSELL